VPRRPGVSQKRQLPSEHWTQDSKHYNSDTYTSWWKYWTITVDFPSHFVTLRLALDGFDPWRQAGFKDWIVTVWVMYLSGDMLVQECVDAAHLHHARA